MLVARRPRFDDCGLNAAGKRIGEFIMRRNSLLQRAVLAAAAFGMSWPLGGCSTHDEFRAVATPAIHNGVSLILNGILDGIFAAAAVEPGRNSN